MSLLNKLKLTTNSSKFIPEIDGLRFFAIILVVIFHLNTSFAETKGYILGEELNYTSIWKLGWWITRMDLGVKVFFSISGFILSIPFLEHYLNNGKKIIIKDYFFRRLLRLEPPYLITLFTFFILRYFVFATNNSLLMNLFFSIFYLHSFIYGVSSPINPVIWSLETEAQFYIIIPFLIALIFRFKSYFISFSLIFALIFISIYIKKEIAEHGPINLSTSILTFLSNFLIGFLFAWFYLKYRSFFFFKKYYWDLIGITSCILLFVFYKPQIKIYNNIFFNISVFIFLCSSFKGVLLNIFFKNKIIFTIGGMCYSIYLLHYGILFFIMPYTCLFNINYGYTINLLLQFFICFPIILTISSLFFIIIEKPCMDKNWIIKLLKKIRILTIKNS
ncbi:MAG: acyltransferase [Bacteroidia bacterium]|nr:acyltransferase [Bacteroidia bacterium]